MADCYPSTRLPFHPESSVVVAVHDVGGVHFQFFDPRCIIPNEAVRVSVASDYDLIGTSVNIVEKFR